MRGNRIIFGIFLALSAFVIFGCMVINQITSLDPTAIQGDGNIVNQKRPVSDFNRIALTGFGEVVISQGEYESLIVETDENLMGYIKTDVQNGTLVLGFNEEARNKNISPSQWIKFTIVAREIYGLDISGSGNMTSQAIETDSLDINIGGSGDMEIESTTTDSLTINVTGSGDVIIHDFNGKASQVRITGSGKIELAGSVINQDILISGSGNYLAEDLKSERGTIRISGSGDAIVWVLDSLDAVISGSGSVNYYGNPSTNLSSSGSGKAKSLGER